MQKGMLKWSLNLGRISGIQLYIHWTFLLLVAWILIGDLSQRGFPEGLLTVAFILAAFFCVTLHELGHALTARKYGIRTKNITLLPIGGLANMERMPKRPIREFNVAITGPLVNVALAIILYIFLWMKNGIPTAEEVQNIQGITSKWFLFHLFVVNALLALFNLLPAFPMDGGRIFRALLSFRMSRHKATRISAQVGQFMAIIFVFVGLFNHFMLVFIGIFIFLGANAENIYENTNSLLERYKVRDVLMHHYIALSPYETLEKAVDHLLDGQDTDFLVTEGHAVRGVLSRSDILAGLRTYGKEGALMKVMRTDFESLTPDMDLQKVYQNMSKGGATVHPVFDEADKLIGILNKENVQELLMVREILQKEEKREEQLPEKNTGRPSSETP
jgi:Zn-dependent protease/predicted transcriptional regulator